MAKKKSDSAPGSVEGQSAETLHKKLLDTLDSQSSINIQMNFWFDEMMRHFDVNYSVYRLLRFLRKYPDGVEPSVIADRLAILRQTVTNMVDDLQKRKLVRRSPHPVDRRRIFVTLTKEGADLAKRLTDEMTSVQNAVFHKFTQAEMETYLELRCRIVSYTEAEIKDRYFQEGE